VNSNNELDNVEMRIYHNKANNKNLLLGLQLSKRHNISRILGRHAQYVWEKRTVIKVQVVHFNMFLKYKMAISALMVGLNA